MSQKEVLQKLQQILKSPAITFDPTPFLLVGSQLYFKFEEMYAHVKGLTSKLDAIITRCEESALHIASLKENLRAGFFADKGS